MSDRIAHLFEIAAFERPLTPAERSECGLPATVDHDRVVHLLERAAFEAPLGDVERAEVEMDLGTAA